MARHAVFTIVQDDPINLRIWATYYRRFYDDVDTFVLHHPLSGQPFDADWLMEVGVEVAANRPAGLSDHGFMLMPGVFREESFNHAWLREVVQAFQRFLLLSYDTVLFAEIDEIVAVDPRHSDMDLREFLDAFVTSGDLFARCTGREVVHDYACEPPLDFDSRPLLRQRTYWYPSTQYNKTLLSRVPLTWVNGFHELKEDTWPVSGPEYSPAPRIDLLLLHLHKLDFGEALARHRRSSSRTWSRHDVATRQGLQNQVADEDWLRGWWLNTVDAPGTRAVWSRMPDAVKDIV